MIRAIRPNAMAQDDASLVAGWNVAPNLAYTLILLPGAASCGVLLYDDDGSTLIATGAALTGTEQPCVLIPQSGQTLNMVAADLGWHLLLTTTGTESQRTIRLGPAVDLPDEIHPVYGDDDMALSRATAAIDAAAHYIDDVTVSCPLGLGAWLGDEIGVPVDGVLIVGQVESIAWTATPEGITEQAVIKRHVPIAPDAFVEPTPPTVADDTGAATHLVGTSGNVLTNDEEGLTVTAVSGLSSNVGVAVDGDNGGSFVINSDGSWSFSPDGDFALLSGSETADTSITYHASDGNAEAMATLTVTVSHANAAPVAVDDVGETTADATTSGNCVANDTDADGDTLTVSKVAGSAANVGVAVAGSSGGMFAIAADGAWTFDPGSDFDALTGDDTATTSVTYCVSDGVAEDEGTLTVTVSATPASAGISFVGSASAGGIATPLTIQLPSGTTTGDIVIVVTGFSSLNQSLLPVVTSDGYTLIYNGFADDSTDTRTALFYKVMGGTPDTEVSVNASNTGRGQAVMALVFRGVDLGSPFDVAHVYAVGSNGPYANSPAITPVTDGAMLLTVGTWVRSASDATTPSGFTPAGSVESPNTYRYTIQTGVRGWVDADGTIDPDAWVGQAGDTGASWIAITLALRPA